MVCMETSMPPNKGWKLHRIYARCSCVKLNPHACDAPSQLWGGVLL